MKSAAEPKVGKEAYRGLECELLEMHPGPAILAGSVYPPGTGATSEGWDEEDLGDD